MGISTFRVDIDVSTCGEVTPLKSLDYLIDSFDSDIITIDYRVRGFTRLANGKKVFIDEKLDTIQNFINKDTVERYNSIDVNVYQENIFHTKMMLKDLELDKYLFGRKSEDISIDKRDEMLHDLNNEMKEIYYGKNINE